MKKYLLLITLLFSFIIVGCSDDNDDNNKNELSQEQLSMIDNTFMDEYKKYVLNDDNSTYTGNFSSDADENIKSILQNITGRGGMPADRGIGTVQYTEVATSISKIIATNRNSAPVLSYSALDKTSQEFMASVMSVFMNDNGMALITNLKHVNDNSQSIISLANSLSTSLGQTNPSENARANMVYLASSLIDYLKNNAQSGIVGIKEEYVLPDNKAFLDEIAQAFMEQGDYVSNYTNWNMPTPEFTVMPLLTNGQPIMGPNGMNSSALQTMSAFMQKLTNIFVKYGYAESQSSN